MHPKINNMEIIICNEKKITEKSRHFFIVIKWD